MWSLEVLPPSLVAFQFGWPGKILKWSPRAQQVFNIQAHTALGLTVAELLGESYETIRNLVDSVLQQGFAEHWIRRTGPSGDPQILQLWIVPVPDPVSGKGNFVGFVSDQTSVLAAEQERISLIEREQKALDLVKAERRFRDLLEAAPDGILEVDIEGRIVLMNAVAEHMFGYSRHELMGQPVEILIPEAARQRHVNHRAEYHSSPRTRGMGHGMFLNALRRDGSEFPVEVSLSPIETEHGRRVTAVVRDVSERRITEEKIRRIQESYTHELAEKNKQLEIRNQEIERANRLKSEFLASMSHELRTPLHTIIGFAELLAEQIEGPLNDKQAKFLAYIRQDSAHLLDLINDILDLSKIESGSLTLRPMDVPLDEVLQEVLTGIRPMASIKSIQIDADVADDLVVRVDRVRLKEIFYNLLSNAVKFTREHGRVWIHTEARGDLIAVTVSDTGIGIAPEEQEAIFENFYQVGNTTKGVREGTGLGLPITKRLVQLHGGNMTLRSETGVGSHFTFTLPLAGVTSGTTVQ